MPRAFSALLLLPVLSLLSACGGSEPAKETRVIIQQQPGQAATVAMAPGPPPLPHSELVPPPPTGIGPVVWQPGHQLYTGVAGNEWAWQPGQYVPPPASETTWVPGRWAQQPSGGWYWIDGHWA